MNKVIIFGTEDTAELAHYYLSNDSDWEVVAFSVNHEYIHSKAFKGLPIVAFENIEKKYPPETHRFFAPMTAARMNQLREKIYRQIKDKGYQCISYVNSRVSICNTKFGENCFILEDNTIQPFVSVGNNVVLWSGNHIGHHSVIKDHVFFTSHVVLSGHCEVENNCFLGVNATVKDRIQLAQGTLVGMSASITKHTEAWGVYTGNPARKKGNKPSYEIY